ncbi:hypothetical protein K461DRAFT_282186 [Myriangium duriaei CBS 260.36]|uniref:Telomere replication protein EST3 n=1 Tax=Myriangium duriaei CBS 260.36 TaxID=1168546 RepID=A0A9P4IUK9_9PEZI|nr:hypothetical protein K461DRAFT_282186 [Myriangium duriaei CBS 260.36]
MQFTSLDPLCRADISDGYSWISVIFDESAVERLERKSGRKIEQLVGGLLNLKAFSFLINRHGHQHQRLMLTIESATFRAGSSKSGNIGHPKVISEHPDCQSMLKVLQKLDTERPRDVAVAKDQCSTATSTHFADKRPEDVSQDGAKSSTILQHNQLDGGQPLASQVSLSPTQPRKHARQPSPDVQILQAPNLASPLSLYRSTDTANARRNLLLATHLHGPKPQVANIVQGHLPSPERQSLHQARNYDQLQEINYPSGPNDGAIVTSGNAITTKPAALVQPATGKSSIKTTTSPTTDRAPDSGHPKNPVTSSPHDRSRMLEIQEEPIMSHKVSIPTAPPTGGPLPVTVVPLMPEVAPRMALEAITSPKAVPPEKTVADPANSITLMPPSAEVSLRPADHSSRGPSMPDARYMKYARRRIPKDQIRLLQHKCSWLPSYPGESFPPGNVPLSVLQALTEHRTASLSKPRSTTTGNNAGGLEDDRAQSTSQDGAADVVITKTSQTVLANNVPEAAVNDSSASASRNTPRAARSPDSDSSQISWSSSPPHEPPIRLVRAGTPPDSSAVSVTREAHSVPRRLPSVSFSSSPPSSSPSRSPMNLDDGHESDLGLPAQVPHSLVSYNQPPPQQHSSNLVEVRESPHKPSSSIRDQPASAPVPATQLSGHLTSSGSAKKAVSVVTSSSLNVERNVTADLTSHKEDLELVRASTPVSSPSKQTASPSRSQAAFGRDLSPPRKRQRLGLTFGADELASQDPALKHAKEKREVFAIERRNTIPPPSASGPQTLRPSSSATSVRSFGSQTAVCYPAQHPGQMCDEPALAQADDGKYTQANYMRSGDVVVIGENHELNDKGADSDIDEGQHEEMVTHEMYDDAGLNGDQTEVEVEEHLAEIISEDEDDDGDDDTFEATRNARKARVWNDTTFGAFGGKYHNLEVVKDKLNELSKTRRHINVLGWRLGQQ